jgi:Fe2+ transport system protein FeoA
MMDSLVPDSQPGAPVPAPTPAEGVLPLSMVTPGQMVELVEICENCKLRKRLIDLGLNVGSCIRVLQSDGSAPVLLAVTCDSRLAVGRTTAHHILVRYPDCERD